LQQVSLWLWIWLMTKRPICSICDRPLNSCLCPFVAKVNNIAALVILQHPLEAKEAKNTGRLLHLCLQNSRIFTGETFAEDFFAQLQLPGIQDVLLYPDTPDEKSLGLTSPPRLDLSVCAARAMPVRLWVLDATWRKSRKMLYLNRHLQRLPRLSLHNCPPSIYKIRKAHSENQLSTLEASCYALSELEQNAVDYSPALGAFARFIAQRQSFQPDRPTPTPDPL
jgi:DTW domain-containing protein